MNITDLLFGGTGAAPFMSMLANGRGPNPFSGRPSMPGLGMPGSVDNMLTYGGEGVSGMDMGGGHQTGAGAGGGMDWATLMQMMSRMGGGGMGAGMGGGAPNDWMSAMNGGFRGNPNVPASGAASGMQGALGGALGNMGGGGQSAILQAMQAALAGMRGGAQPMSPVNSMMRYR